MLRILHYTAKADNDNREYIILTENEDENVIEENQRTGFKLNSDQKSDELDSMVLPLDRELKPSF